ncbi:hypothetical protein [Caulobacter rhizosphaerae]|uniref:hypothetical protein n=1 Tax=Caulobacter rhizosphaerae TaxID=2010972 RepID=UPI0013D18AB6|nr:hypothetical protein [Caulobacter rhizosphaerae]GGL17725.1 hypothetical protein GCM10010983_13870 [Caulobacter rhizosphaerae]
MKSLPVACALAALAVVSVPAQARQSGLDEVVVTGARMTDYDPVKTPFVTLGKRADNLITTVRVVCDTRDLSQRKQELKATLRNMIKAAPGAGIELGLEGEEVIGRFDDTMLDAVIHPDGKPDTSVALLVVKTRVAPADTFDAATGRIKAFAEKTAKAGRTEILPTENWNLTLIGPQRYRGEVLALVAEDARKVAGTFGSDYAVAAEGLQLPLSWYQSGPLELALYVPYKLTVTPRPK